MQDLSYTVGGNAKWYSHSEQIVWLFLRKLNIFLAYDPSIVLTLEVKISIYTKKLCMAVARSRMQNNTDILIIAMKNMYSAVKDWQIIHKNVLTHNTLANY